MVEFSVTQMTAFAFKEEIMPVIDFNGDLKEIDDSYGIVHWVWIKG